MTAYYNEHDPFAASWLRELIKAGHIPAGDVDERSIEDVTPDEIKSYTQCHFFAGIGGWPHALRLAGWPDDRPVWTGSAPCQPFSAAGKGGGFADERHLWPAFLWLISQQRPPVIFGEQVASKAGRDWFDVVSSDLEAHGYAVGAADLCAAGVGAPHIRQRLYFVAAASLDRGGALNGKSGTGDRKQIQNRGCCVSGVLMADADWASSARQREHGGQRETEKWLRDGFADSSEHDFLDNAVGLGCAARRREWDNGKYDGQQLDANGGNVGFWSDFEWLPCIDGKARPTQPGLFPLAHGVPARVGRLRGYGNAIVPPLAAEFVGAYMDGL